MQDRKNFKRKLEDIHPSLDLVMEKHDHHCCCDVHFVENFKHLFDKSDYRLLSGNTIFNFKINDELEI
jgi:hypothetical protein